jgi:hypothetical protein
MTPWQPILQSVARILMMNSFSRRQPLLFVPSRVTLGRQPTLHGEGKSSRGCSSIVRAGAARLIPMPWSWIFLLMAHILLALMPTMTVCLLRPSAFTKS